MNNSVTFALLATYLLTASFASAQITTALNAESTSESASTSASSNVELSFNAAPSKVKRTKVGYKNFFFGLYGGLNSTKLKGETTGGDISARLGYQAGFFVRGGSRLFGQIGGEYFASSSNYFTRGDGNTISQIQDQIDIRYIQIPVYIGYKLLESDRGISALRLQLGGEYANRISANSGKFNLDKSEIKSGSFNALGQLGFDIGPLLIDLTYHYGLSDAINGTGFNGSTRRILSASIGFKF